MASPPVFSDIAGPDDEGLRDFSASVSGWEFDDGGRVTVEATSPPSAAVHPDPAEKRIYPGVPETEDGEPKVP